MEDTRAVVILVYQGLILETPGENDGLCATPEDASQRGGVRVTRFYRSRYLLEPIVYVQEEGVYRTLTPSGQSTEKMGNIPPELTPALQEISEEEVEDLVGPWFERSEERRFAASSAAKNRPSKSDSLTPKQPETKGDRVVGSGLRAAVAIVGLLLCLAGVGVAAGASGVGGVSLGAGYKIGSYVLATALLLGGWSAFSWATGVGVWWERRRQVAESRCPACGGEVSRRLHASCPHCGYRLR
jgi:hypothetical protein